MPAFSSDYTFSSERLRIIPDITPYAWTTTSTTSTYDEPTSTSSFDYVDFLNMYFKAKKIRRTKLGNSLD